MKRRTKALHLKFHGEIYKAKQKYFYCVYPHSLLQSTFWNKYFTQQHQLLFQKKKTSQPSHKTISIVTHKNGWCIEAIKNAIYVL